MTTTPTQEQVEDFLLSCRYGELEEVQAFVEKFGAEAVVQARDDRANTAVHMCCGNGHTEVLKFLLPSLPASLLTATNENGSPPLHWAILNNHVAIVQMLVDVPEEQGGGLPILKQKNRQDRDAFMESIFAGEGKEEVSGWIEGYLYKAEGGDDEEMPAEGESTTEAKGDGVDEVTEQTEEVTLKDA